MGVLKLEVETRANMNALRDWEIPTLDKLAIYLDSIGADVVKYLQSYTNTWRPPDRRAGSSGMRRAHPGGWADVTHDLERNYGYRVERLAGSVQLVFFNTSEHAVYVEAMDGFWVLTGVTNENSEVVQRIKRALRTLAPDWRVL